MYYWRKNLEPLGLRLEEKDDPAVWSEGQVVKFVRSIPGCGRISGRFDNQKIDGLAFLLLSQADLLHELGLKLGHATKIYNAILYLRQNSELARGLLFQQIQDDSDSPTKRKSFSDSSNVTGSADGRTVSDSSNLATFSDSSNVTARGVSERSGERSLRDVTVSDSFNFAARGVGESFSDSSNFDARNASERKSVSDSSNPAVRGVGERKSFSDSSNSAARGATERSPSDVSSNPSARGFVELRSLGHSSSNITVRCVGERSLQDSVSNISDRGDSERFLGDVSSNLIAGSPSSRLDTTENVAGREPNFTTDSGELTNRGNGACDNSVRGIPINPSEIPIGYGEGSTARTLNPETPLRKGGSEREETVSVEEGVEEIRPMDVKGVNMDVDAEGVNMDVEGDTGANTNPITGLINVKEDVNKYEDASERARPSNKSTKCDEVADDQAAGVKEETSGQEMNFNLDTSDFDRKDKIGLDSIDTNIASFDTDTDKDFISSGTTDRVGDVNKLVRLTGVEQSDGAEVFEGRRDQMMDGLTHGPSQGSGTKVDGAEMGRLAEIDNVGKVIDRFGGNESVGQVNVSIADDNSKDSVKMDTD
ncbi:dentin sialophosphoprotein [Diaphorina citri]|uniref:Dentin sialophosphoprotein n=1 Tax=Diaphorina citri TaxID=121845 RepID=A0A3Q0ITC1_DIACI|nr:dentin sialophosphoprotein [Diaphorina citri]